MNTFATLDDFKEYSGLTELPDNAQFLVKRANELVSFRVKLNFIPGNEKHVDAAKNAVCAQVMFWVSANVSPVDISVSSGFSLGDLSISESSAGAVSPTNLCPMALAYLRSEGLTYKGLPTSRTSQEV